MCKFEVEYQGRYIYGPPEILIEKDSSTMYNLMFSPLVPFEGKGSISFYNVNYGEIWYEINLISTQAKSKSIISFLSEIGENNK